MSRLLVSPFIRNASTLNVLANNTFANAQAYYTTEKVKPKQYTSKRMEEVPKWERKMAGDTGRFPEFIEKWGRGPFKKTGYGLIATTAVLGAVAPPTALVLGPLTAVYWFLGLRDINQSKHTIRRNFPILGNVRYLFESIRPEIRQYFIEDDDEDNPFGRRQRSTIYQRAKNMQDTIPFGTTFNVYGVGYEWVNHSIWPKEVPKENQRVKIGGPACKQPYSASLLNISAMSYGALSDNALLALNNAARKGKFYHNTGEGGISHCHEAPGGDIVWNVGTGYFGCRTADGKFNPDLFKEKASMPQVKMIEIKLSQGAKPAHGGILPKDKLTEKIAQIRGVKMGEDVISPPRHSAFDGPIGLLQFVAQLRELSGGKPVGFKLCVGRPDELAAMVIAMVETGIAPDFITVDGSEGGTGAAPPEFTNRVGTPLTEGLALVNNFLIGAGLRDQIKIICAGKVFNGFSIVKNLALGADLCNSARGMMFALGCIQALKCNTNHCPSGVATQDPILMAGLNVEDKASRVYSFHKKTVHAALELIGAAGLDHPDHVEPKHLMERISATEALSFEDQYPTVDCGSLLDGTAKNAHVLSVWEQGHAILRRKKSRGKG